MTKRNGTGVAVLLAVAAALAGFGSLAADSQAASSAGVKSAFADRYFASVRASDIDRYIALFAEDATFVFPDGRTLTGRAAIRDMEAQTFASGAPTPTPVTTVVSGNIIAVEVELRAPNGSVRRFADFFQLNNKGLIQRQAVYRQGS